MKLSLSHFTCIARASDTAFAWSISGRHSILHDVAERREIMYMDMGIRALQGMAIPQAAPVELNTSSHYHILISMHESPKCNTHNDNRVLGANGDHRPLVCVQQLGTSE